MPVIDVNTAMDILQLSKSDAAKYNLVESLVPIVQQDIVSYCQNDFRDPRAPKFEDLPDVGGCYTRAVYLYTSGIIFNGKIISVPSGNFTTAGFYKGMNFVIEGSRNNDGIYQVNPGEEISATNIKVVTPFNQNLITETSTDICLLTKVLFPPALKATAAMMIRSLMQKDSGTSLTSERIGDWSASYNRTGQYPEEILSSLRRFRKFKAGR